MDCFVASLLAMTWRVRNLSFKQPVNSIATVIPRAGGRSSTPRPFRVIASAAKQSIAPQVESGLLRCARNDDERASHSRGTTCPRFAFRRPSSKQRAQGRPGARCTRGLACNVRKKRAHEHTGSAEAFRPSLRNGFTAYFVLSPVNGSFATVAPEKLASSELDASTAASGPHDFAVRSSHTRQSQLSRPPHLTARS